MPTKLIRLTSDSGDGVFSGLFNQEIEIKENSEIALQSLSVERKSQEILINGGNNDIDFNSVAQNTTQNAVISPQQLYNITNNDALFENISAAMNRTCDFTSDPPNAFGQWGVQHKAFVNDSGVVEVAARNSPFYQIQKPVNCDFVVDNRSVENNIAFAEKLNVWAEFQAGEDGMWRETDTTTGGGGSEPNFNESYVFGTEPITKSTGIFRTRFKRLNTNGAGTASFTMGLVKGVEGLDKLRTSTLALTDIEYAIRANGHNAAIQYLNVKGGNWISSVIPVNHTTADWEDNLNDVLDIRVLGGEIKGVITSETANVPTATTLNNLIGFDNKADYFWFISMHEGKNNCVLDLTGVTLDPWYALEPYKGGFIPTAARLNNDAPGVIGDSEIEDLPVQDWQEFNEEQPFEPQLELSKSLATYLGFNNAEPTQFTIIKPVSAFADDGTAYFVRTGYSYEADAGFDNSYDSDTYIVDTQTFTLDSFDSYGLSSNERNANSGGSRRNIIATIPISEVPIVGSPNSIIQYQPNTLYFVAIKNRGSIVTRQIRCKLLTGMYNPVRTEGLASIVLLIREQL